MQFECNTTTWGIPQVTLEDTPLSECLRQCEEDPSCEWAVRVPSTNQCRLFGEEYAAHETWCRRLESDSFWG